MGLKTLYINEKKTALQREVMFVPLFSQDSLQTEIIGTQIVELDPKGGIAINFISMANFKPSEYQFPGQGGNFGFKKYIPAKGHSDELWSEFGKEDASCQSRAILFEVRLHESTVEGHSTFEAHIMTHLISNMLKHSIEFDVLKRLQVKGKLKISKYNPHVPLQVLKFESISSIQVFSKEILTDLYISQKDKENLFYQSMLNEFFLWCHRGETNFIEELDPLLQDDLFQCVFINGKQLCFPFEMSLKNP